MCSCDIEPSRVWDERKTKARKQRACEECDHDIVAGETYVRVGALHDGHWSTISFCLFCHAFASEAQRAGVCAEIGSLYTCSLEWAEDGEWTNGKWQRRRLEPGDRELAADLAGRPVGGVA